MGFNDEYQKLRKKRLEGKSDNDNSAPGLLYRNKTATAEDIAPVVTTPKTETEEKRKWYDGFVQLGDAFKDGYQFGDVTKTLLGTDTDIATNLISGVVGWGEDAIDAGATLAGTVATKLGKNDAAAKISEFVQKDLYDENKVARKILTSDLLPAVVPGSAPFSTAMKAIFTIEDWLNPEKEVDNGFGGTIAVKDDNSVLGDTSDSLIQATGESFAKMGLPGKGYFSVGDIITGVTVFGEQSEQALKEDATFMQAGGSGLISAAAEIMFEKLSGGIKIGGRTLDEGLTKIVSKNISNVALRNAAHLGLDVVGEAGEEVATEFVGKLGTKLYKEEDLGEILFSEDALVDYIQAAIGGGLMGGGFNVSGAVSGAAQGVDYKTGLNNDEAKVFDTIVDERIAEQEKDGKKLKGKEKEKIREQVMRDLERGSISVDDIERILGGESYNTYKSMADTETAKQAEVQKQIEELENLPNEKITFKQAEQLKGLRQELQNLKDSATAPAWKDRLSESVYWRANGTRLAESYNERARRGQAFEADLTQYKSDAAKQTVQNAIDFGMNNGNDAHDFVDFAAKISEDKGYVVEFTDPEKLAESVKNGNPYGIEVDPERVEALVDDKKKVILINMKKGKAFNSLIGHELMHTLEQSGYNADIQKFAKAFTEAKGEYASKFAEIERRYQGTNANLNAEFTADIVGEYLFTDYDFVKSLSVEHRNVFQKIYDEIKHLYKLATAGSREARELERLKRTFEKAYKESGASGDTADVKFALDKYNEKQYNTFGWARDMEAISKNELDDMYSKIHEKGSLKKFTQTANGEAIIEVNDNPHATLGTDNVFVFVTGTKNNPQINRVVRFQAETDTEMEIIKEKLYERGSFSYSYYSFLEQYGLATEYSRKSALDYTGYEEKVRRGSRGADSNRANGNRGIEQNGTRAFEQTESNEITPINKASSDGGVFFDGYKPKYSLSDKNIKDFSTDYANGEYYHTMVYTQDGTIVGKLDYGVYDEKPNVKMIEVDPEYRRRGIATKLMQELQKKYPDAEINFGMSTPDGSKLLDAITYDVTDEAIAADVQKLKDLQAELDDLQAKLDTLYEQFDAGTLTEAQEAEMNSLGDRWEEVYESIRKLEPALQGKKATKTFVKTDTKYSLSEADADYQAAVESNDTVALHTLVDDAAKAAGYQRLFYHGTPNGDFTKFGGNGKPMWITDNRGYAETYAKNKSYNAYDERVMELYAKMDNVLDITQVDTSKPLFDENRPSAALNQMAQAIGVDVSVLSNMAKNTPYTQVWELVNTKKFADIARKQGFDTIKENEFGNITYGVLAPMQLKSAELVTRKRGKVVPLSERFNTKKKDIRYSLTEYTAEEKKAHNDAVLDHFGRTFKWNETGYLLLNGARLDLSGKHDGAPGGYRTVDHRDITDALGYDYGGGEYSGSLIQFMSEGNIRIVPEIGGINLSVMPTKAQEDALSDFISRNRGEVVLDIDDLKGNTVVSVEYPRGTYYKKVLDDIREWFDNGKEPEVSGLSSFRSLSAEGEAPSARRRDGWRIYAEDVLLEQEVAPVRGDVPKTDVAEQVAPETVAPVADAQSWRSIAENMPDEVLDENGEWTESYLQEHNRIRDTVSRMSVNEVIGDIKSGLSSQELKAKSNAALAEYEQVQARAKDGITEADRLMLTALYNQYTLYDSAAKSPDRVLKMWDDAPTSVDEAEVLQKEYFNSLDDADAPPEVEAPYYESDNAPLDDPFEKRDIKDVGNRKVKAYMYENPEVKPFFQQEADILLGELGRTTKGERFYTETPDGQPGVYGAESYGVWTGTSRDTSPDIAYLLDTLGYSYAEIENGLKAIIEDNGAENNACSKRIEFILHDRLVNGYSEWDVLGGDVPPNQEYINLLKEKQIMEYTEEARKQFFDVADRYAPPAKNSEIVVEPIEDIAPVAEKYEAIRPQKQQKEPSMKRVDSKTESKPESKIAKVLTESEEQQTKKKGSNAWAMFKNNVLDKGMVFEDLSLKTGNRELQARWNTIRYAESKAQKLIGEGNASVSSLQSMRQTVENSGKAKQFFEYMYHKHNIDRMSLEAKAAPTIGALHGKFGHLAKKQIQAIAAKEITDTTTERTAKTIREAKEYLNAIETKNKPVFGDDVTADVSREKVAQFEKANPEFKSWAQDVYGYMNYLREMLVDDGVISRDTARLWAEMYPNYVPIRRAGKDGMSINVPLDTGRTGVNAPIKRAEGGNSDILPLFDTMAMRTQQTYRAIARNRFGVELKNTLGTTIDNTAQGVDDTIDSIDNHDELLQEGKNGAKPTFTVFENGEKVTFEISEEMYDAMKPTSKELAYTNKVLNTASNVFRGLLTEYNPVFMTTNAAKDAQDILINSQHPARTYAAIPKAISQMAKGGHYYQEYLNNGGEQNTYFEGESKTFKAEDEGWKKVVGMPLRGISYANNIIERLPRLAEYIASREAGQSVDVSMLDAARVTTNFAAGGDLTKAINRNGGTFLNASMQGALQQVRNVREAKANGLKGWVQLAAKVTAAGLPAMLLNALLWDDDEEYEELSDYVKQNYYVVAKYGDGKFVRIPKGRTVAVIQNAFQQVSNALTGDDEVDLQSFLELAISNLAPNNPLENNIFAPIKQVVENKTWYGEDLVPTRLQDLPAAEQYDESTDALSRWLGETLDVSPYKINYLLNQYSGGVGDVLLPMLTPEAESGDNSVIGNILAPFKDKFTTDSTMKNQGVSDFYDTVDELTKNAKSSKATDEDVLKYKYMNSVNAELSELYKQKREIQNSKLSDAEKYDAVRDIQRQIDDLAKESLETYGDVYINDGYATVGDRHYQLKDGEWQKISDEQLEKQNEVVDGLGIDPSEYWSNKSEYDFAYEYPEKYAVAKSVGGYERYKTYSSELYDIKADKDEDGKSITGSRKEKVIEYINNLDADYGEKLILFKSEYNADDTYNEEIIDYLNNREDISYDEMVTILLELGFTVKNGNVYWD